MQFITRLFDKFVAFLEDYVLIPFMNIGVADVIDILLLSMILYWCYVFIRDRRAGKLAVGMLVVIILFCVCEFFNMHATNYVFRNFYQIGIIALVIIFQPELRDALEKVGTAPQTIKGINGQPRSLATVTGAIGVLSESVCELAKDKTGALIVIERTTKLGDYVTTGVEIDAKLTNQLIRNIFFNKSPLHDGAVIIRDFKIASAACILPASKNDAVFSDMGTRHRAALGISEVSDAIVIVVSEETGTISIANNGIMKRGYNSGSIKEDLFLLLTGNTSEEIEKMLKQNHDEINI